MHGSHQRGGHPDQAYDLIVIGGGVVGAGIARDAALRGLRTALFEARDLAWGTSSRSSKLAHGGIRYLETGDLRLVREACIERKRLLDLAPHAVRRLPFLIPIYRGDPRAPWIVRIGTFLYGLLAGTKGIGHSCRLSANEVLKAEPGIQPEGLRGGVIYWDAQMDDALLNVLTAQGAAEAGADIFTYTPVTGIHVESGLVCGVRVHHEGASEPLEVRGKAVVNATGPWSDTVSDLETSGSSTVRLRRTKGVHILTPSRTRSHALLLMAKRDQRVFFVIPYEGLSMVGTTDTDYGGDPGNVQADEKDIEYLLGESGRAFRNPIQRSEVISHFAGVRPLLASSADSPSKASREHEIVVSPSGLVSVVGGKYTTYRAMAEQTVDLVVRRFSLDSAGPCRTRNLPLPGGEACEDVESAAEVIPDNVRSHLRSRYGSRARELERLVAEIGPAALEPLAGGRPEVAVEVIYAKRHLWAKRPEDFLRRRSPLELVGAVTPTVEERVAELLSIE